jgi:hypothetical protein
LDAGAVRRLKKSWVRGGYEVPAKRVEVRGEDVGCVETLAGEMAPVRLRESMRIGLPFPEDGEVLTLGVILEAGKTNERLFPTGFTSGFDGFHQISATPNLYDLSK